MRLQERVQIAIRSAGYSLSTERSYWDWIKRFIKFHKLRHPDILTGDDVRDFLTHLVMKKHVAVSTQQQELSALVFLYKQVLGRDSFTISDWQKSKRPKKLPVVFSLTEANSVLSYLKGTPLLVAQLMYGAGLRLKEALRLRVQDVDFGRMEITVRHGKGGKDRMTLLPKASVEALRVQIESSRLLHQKALEEGTCFVHLPHALARKYPNAGRELAWQYIFASTQLSKDPRTGNVGRHHIHERGIQSAVKHAVRRAGVNKNASCHTFRHSFATHLLEMWLRYQNRSRVVGSCQCQHNNDIYPCT